MKRNIPSSDDSMLSENAAQPADTREISNVGADGKSRPAADLFNIAYYILVFLLIGLPLWWVTTTTTRVSLPYDEIASLNVEESATALKDPSQRWKAFWSLSPTTAVDIIVTVVNPVPERMVVEWDVEKALKDHMEPALRHLSDIATLRVSSQVLHYMDSSINPSNSEEKTIQISEASKIINAIENRLGSFSSNNNILNFVIYVPPPEQQPLQLITSSGKQSATNSFVSPRWGGVLIHPGSSKTQPGVSKPVVTIDTEKAIPIILTQILGHFGVEPSDTAGSYKEEIERLVEKRSRLNIDDTISTLRSLSRLLEQIEQIAINELVAGNVYDAALNVKHAQTSYAAGDFRAALNYSRRAWEKAEQAFYDPSLLEQLYFPSDQKFAIYVPLFLPAGIPVLMSVREIVKWIKAKKELR